MDGDIILALQDSFLKFLTRLRNDITYRSPAEEEVLCSRHYFIKREHLFSATILIAPK